MKNIVGCIGYIEAGLPLERLIKTGGFQADFSRPFTQDMSLIIFLCPVRVGYNSFKFIKLHHSTSDLLCNAYSLRVKDTSTHGPKTGHEERAQCVLILTHVMSYPVEK